MRVALLCYLAAVAAGFSSNVQPRLGVFVATSIIKQRSVEATPPWRPPGRARVAPRLAAEVEASVLVDAESIEPAKKKRGTPWKTLFRLCKPDLPLLVVAFISLTIAASGDALLPALQGAALNTALGLETQGHASLRGALLNLVGVGIGTALFTGIRGFAFWLCGARLVSRLRQTLFEALLKQPQAFHDDQGPGELSTRLATDCVKLGDVLSLNVNIVLRQVRDGVLMVTEWRGDGHSLS